MKAALLIYVVGSFLIVTVVGGGEEPMPTPTPAPPTNPPPKIQCGCNMDPTPCNPCNQVCNEPPRPCALFCLEEVKFCACKPGFSLRKSNSKSCIPTSKCPKPKPTCPPDTKSG